MKLVVLGLSLSSSWGNGHATTYRALLRACAGQGHDVLFLERDVPWYASQRDLPEPDFCRLVLYPDLAALHAWHEEVASADAVIVGSYVPDGIAVGDWVLETAGGVTAFYDIDTPVTLAALASGGSPYVAARQIARYGCYLSFSGGRSLDTLRDRYGARLAHALYCSVDTDSYRPLDVPPRWDLSYLGTYSADRQPALQRLLLDPARQNPSLRCVVAGPQYAPGIAWPDNVERIEHVVPADHAAFYSASRATLNVTRADMIAAGHSPSVRLFEAAACGTAIISDAWEGLLTLFDPNEIGIAESATDVLRILAWPEMRLQAQAAAGRRRILAAHAATHRARELVDVLQAAAGAALGDRTHSLAG